ncbi:MAG: peptidoglycan DD-metalloendopeptidase family protein [Actinobacteria bacterium]|nr:peptidoglycan DD-metalloendopeptidase family protein [Actinomycetota bacterium]
MRRPLLASTLVLALLAGLVGSVPASAHDYHQRLEEIADRIAHKKALIKDANADRRTLLELIADSDRRRHDLEGKLAEIGALLEIRESELRDVQRELERREARLIELEGQIRLTTERLESQIETLDRRAALAYQYGPGGYLGLILGAESMGDLISRDEFIGYALVSDSSAVDDIRQTREEIRVKREMAEIQRAEVEESRDLVQAQVDRIAGIKLEQESLLSQVEQEIAVRESALDEVEATKYRAKQAIKELEAQSAKIEELLRKQGSQGPGHYGGELYWPTAGGIGSGFGLRYHPILHYYRMHYGVDIGGACSQPIWAAEDGVVISAGYNGGYGYATVIDHGGGLATLYAHQSSIQVGVGQHVNRAQQIGLVGSTGLSTACHLHFEVRVNGVPVDPVPYLT